MFLNVSKAYDRALDLDKNRFLARFRSGAVLRFIGSSEAALQQLQKANLIKPNFVPVLNELVLAGLNHAAHQVSLGLVQAARVTLTEARKAAQHLCTLNIFKPLVDVDLSLALLVNFDKAQWTSLLSEARDAAKRSIGSEAERALDVAVCEYFLQQGDVKAVVELLNSALHLSVAKTTAFNTLLTAAAVFSAAKLDSSAHMCLIEASKLDDRSSKPLLALAQLYMKSGHFGFAQRA